MLEVISMCKEEDKEMFAIKKQAIKKPVIRKNKFKNLTTKDMKESNDSSKENRGISGITYEDVYGG